MSLHVGEIAYTNTLPFFFELDRSSLEQHGICITQNVPAHINHMLASGELQAAAISSFSYGKNEKDYVVLPDLCVASAGMVHSLLLFSKVPINKLEGESVALTTSSETTVHLLKIVLKRFYQVTPCYKQEKPDLANMLTSHTAALLIGDDAIRERHADVPYVYDLGQLWYEWTGLPMTYALFAVRKDALESKAEEINVLYQSLRKSYLRTAADGYRQINRYLARKGMASLSFWDMYFEALLHQPTSKTEQGLLYYFQLCYEEGFLEREVPTLRKWRPTTSVIKYKQ
jgi:chorismate dehydratase